MEETPGKDESTVSTIDIFLCYAHEDKEYRQHLEKQLSSLQRNGRIRLWHNENINPGEAREQVTLAHVNTAQIVLLLVSPNFMASNSCYHVMEKALERHKQEKIHVIPIIVSPVDWQDGPLKGLQALPKRGKSIRSAPWRNLDEALFEVAKDIRHVLDEIKAQPPVFIHRLETGILEQQPLSEAPGAKHAHHQEATVLISSEDLPQALMPQLSTSVEDDSLPLQERTALVHNKNWRKRRLLVSAAILLVLTMSLIPFLPLPTCSFAICHSSPQPAKQPSPQNEGEIQDQNLSVEFIDMVSPSFVFPDDPNRYPGGYTPPTNISAVLLPKNTISYCDIIVAVKNLRFGGVDILIDDIALKLQQIPVIPRPLRIWMPGASTTYNAYPYPVTYQGQSLDQLPNQLLDAAPPQNIILQPARSDHVGESNQLSIQVMSSVTVYLQFQIQVSYQIANAARVYTLTLPRIFRVVFSDASNWQEYILKNGSFLRKP
jgi:hypothetical protein